MTVRIVIAAFALTFLPAQAAEYVIDPQHTYPSFEFPHMGISMWRGKFDRTRGSVALDRETGTGAVDIVVDTASVNFGLAAMDESARSDKWFDVKQYPNATYKGAIVFADGVPVAVDGQFTFRGVTQPLRLAINTFKCIEHPVFKREVCGADASGELNWSTFGMAMSEYGKGDAGRVTLRIQVEAFRQE